MNKEVKLLSKISGLSLKNAKKTIKLLMKIYGKRN